MRGLPWAICLWPGLPQLWVRGSWIGLAWAIGFTLLLNFTLVVSFVWIEWVSPAQRFVAWLVLVGFWFGSVVVGVCERWRGESADAGLSTGAYEAALGDYLQGNWLAAETGWHQALEAEPRDVDTLLMLATLYRHTRRYDEAGRMLRRLERIETSVKWCEEIAAEKRWLSEARETETCPNEPDGGENVSLIENELQSEIADAA